MDLDSRWVKCIATHGNIRGVAVQAPSLIQKMKEQHQLSPRASRGLGEAVIGALLLSSYCKPGQRINLNIQGSGLYQRALVDAYPEGHVRGYVVESQSQLETAEQTGPWGSGFLSVLRTRDQEGEKPYIGTVPLLTGHLAKDLSFYWVQSEQIRSAVGLSVNMNGDRVESAGGFLVQALPGAEPSEVQMIEQHIFEMHSMREVLYQDPDPVQILSQIFQSTAFIIVEEKQLEARCNCSWERVQRALTLVGVAELKSMLVEDRSAVVRCDFCGKEYKVDEAALERLISYSQT